MELRKFKMFAYTKLPAEAKREYSKSPVISEKGLEKFFKDFMKNMEKVDNNEKGNKK